HLESMSVQENFPMLTHLIHILKTTEYRERSSQKLTEFTLTGTSVVVSAVVRIFTLSGNATVLVLTTLATSFFLSTQASSETIYIGPHSLVPSSLMSQNNPPVLCRLDHHQLLCGHVKIFEMSSLFHLYFCDAVVAYFFCDLLPAMKHSFIATPIHEVNSFMGLVYISCTDALITSTMLWIASSLGFATCTSHLTMAISETYTIISLLLGPVVYSVGYMETKDTMYIAMDRSIS
ncbi:hypothetical protein EI555_001984, partial [Monodon monoceros]